MAKTLVAAIAILALSGSLDGSPVVILQDKVPEASALKEAEKALRLLFKDDYANKTLSGINSLSAKLMKMGMDTKDDLATQFVALREARDLAITIGNADVALQSLNFMVRYYAMDAKENRLEILKRLGKTVKSPEQARIAAKFCEAFAEEAARKNDYEGALQYLDYAEKNLRVAKNLSLIVGLQGKAKRMSEIKREYDIVAKIESKLTGGGDLTPDEYLALGRFEAFVKEDWEGGLKRLSKCGDEVLRQLAEKDMAADGSPPEAQVTVGDSWWGLAPKIPAARNRALHWYKKGWPVMEGVGREKVRAKFKSVFFRNGKPGGVPKGWEGAQGKLLLDDSCSVSGRRSLLILPREKVEQFYPPLKPYRTGGTILHMSMWVLSDGTDKGYPVMNVGIKEGGKWTGNYRLSALPDQPWWTKVEVDIPVPVGAENDYVVLMYVASGKVWVDDMSLMTDTGMELIEAGDFEH